MAGVDEALEGVRAAVGLVDGVRVHAVVPPAVLSREGGDRHQLDEVDTELDEVVEVPDRGVEGALRR